MGRFKTFFPMAALVLMNACSGCPMSGGEGSVPVVVQTIVERQSSPQVTVYGTINPSNRAEIQFPRTVKIDKVYVTVGDSVAAGAPLLKLSDDDLTVQLNQLRAQKREQEALLDKVKSTPAATDKPDVTPDQAAQPQTQPQPAAVPSEQSIRALEATLDRIKTDIAVAEHDLANQTIASPIAGQVVSSHVSPGIQYAANDVLMTVANMDPVILTFPVSIDDAQGVNVGTPITIKMEGGDPTPIASTVSYIGPTVNPVSKTFDAWATLTNPQGLYKINMRGTVDFMSSITHRVFVVPAVSLTMREHDATLFLVKNGIARRTPVVVRQVTGDEAVLDSGVQAGELVVVQGWEKLQDGSSVDLRR